MDRQKLRQIWTQWWEGDIWIAPWSKALAGLTPQQAAWSPAPGRHSIWQLVTHVLFWRGVTFARLAGQPVPDDATIEAQQFAPPQRVDDDSWRATREALEQSHQRIIDAVSDDATPLDRFQYHLGHDAYHLGQIMYLRAMQGLPPIT
ncbi:MAG: DinB family protein [Phycisphaerales bacterium]|nr:MAG: DinB family protein [Phycisphaerales bacterium]